MNDTSGVNAASAAQEFAAFVAIDWGNEEHCWAMQTPRGRERGKLPHTPEAIEEWAAGLTHRFPGQSVAVALEQARGALLYALCKYAHLVLFPVHPATSCRYRTALFPSGAKDDPTDADLLLDLLVHHRHHLRPLKPDTAQTRKLQLLVEKRRQMVDIRTRHINSIIAHLKMYFPQALGWFEELHSPLFADFLNHWPTLQQLQRAKPGSILKFLHKHNCRSEALNSKRLEEIAAARPLTDDPAVVEPCSIVVKGLLDAVAVLRATIQALERSIETVCAEHPDYGIFASFPSAGSVFAPRLLAVFGSMRDRFASASDVQTFSGIAPVIQRSGRSVWIHFRWACPKFIRQTFHEYAGLSIQTCDWARAFYDKQREKGKGHHAAVRSLAFKWIPIMYRCWRDSVEYSEQHHLDTRATRAKTASPKRRTKMKLQFQTAAGFQKFSALRT